MLTQNSLAHFTGSETFTRYMAGFILSEGAAHVAKEGGAFWLLDVIVSYQFEPKFQAEDFQVWKLKVQGERDPENVTAMRPAVVSCEDGNGNVLTTQEIEATDFPLSEVTLWLQNKTIFLPSEY